MGTLIKLKLHSFPLAFAIFLFLSSNVLADVVVNFEDLPVANMFLGGDQNIGTFYSGIDFESNVTGLDLSGSTAFPPHSGSIAVWDPVDLSVNISFTSPSRLVGIWYTSIDPLTLAAFDGTGARLGSVVGPADTDGTTGLSEFLSFSASDVSSVTLTGIPGNFVFDDVTFEPVPEPSSLGLLTAVILIFGWVRRRFGERALPR